MGDAVEDPGLDAPIEACIQAGGVETPYLRAGRGATLLLLLGVGPEAWRVEVFEVLRRLGRVVRPELVDPVWGAGAAAADGNGVDPERWLRDLLEGLGLDRPLVVLDRDTHTALEGFRTRNGQEVGGWIVLAPGTLPDIDGFPPAPETSSH